MSEEGDQIMKLQRKMKEKAVKAVLRKRHVTKLDQVLAARGIK